MLQPKDISQLSHLTAQGVLMLPVETPSGIVGYVLIQDVLNLVSAPNLSAYMTKTEYASGTTGVVLNALKFNGQDPSFYLNTANITDNASKRFVTDAEKSAWNAKIDASEKGASNGVAPLSGGVIPLAYMPFKVYDLKGTWDANTNTPTLSDATGTVKSTYICSTDGTQNLGSGSITFAKGDIIVHTGVVWQKTNNTAGVTSWNGSTGVVSVTTANLPDSTDKRYVTDLQQDALDAANSPSTSNPFATMNDVNFGTLNYQNSWNASTNTPALADGAGTAADAYIVGVAGTQNLGSGAITFAVGDLVVYNGTIWQKVPGVGIGVSSWNTLTGAVNVTTSNLPESTNKRYVTDSHKDALVASASPSTANPFQTKNDIDALREATRNGWDASANVPTLSDGTGAANQAYIVTVAATRNLGSGNITFAVSDLIVHNGSVWVKYANGGIGVSSWNGSTGVVTADADDVPESATRKYVTSAQKDALNGAASPSASNPFATMDDINNPVITVVSEWHTPEQYADTQILGNGTQRFLNTLTNPHTGVAYTNVSASAVWDKVTGIDVTTWTIDDVAINQAFRVMEGNLSYNELQLHDNKAYYLNQHHQLPATKSTSSANRAFQFLLNGHGSIVKNTSSVNGVMWQRMPADQNQAVNDPNNYVQYNYKFSDLQIVGVDNGTTQDVAMQIGATYGSHFDNVTFANFYRGIEVHFGMLNQFYNCKFNDNYNRGAHIVNGTWSGGGLNVAESNGTSFMGCKFRVAPGAECGLYVYGSDGITIGGAQTVFEGSAASPAPTHHIMVNGAGSTTVKMVSIENIHFEQLTGRSNIYIEAPAQIITAYIRNCFVQGVNNAFVEANPSGGSVQVKIENIPDNSSGWKLRQHGTSGSFWNIYGVRLIDKTNARSTSNWDTSNISGVAGTVPNAAAVYMSPEIMN